MVHSKQYSKRDTNNILGEDAEGKHSLRDSENRRESTNQRPVETHREHDQDTGRKQDIGETKMIIHCAWCSFKSKNPDDFKKYMNATTVCNECYDNAVNEK